MQLLHVSKPNIHIPNLSIRLDITAEGHPFESWHLATSEGRSIRGTVEPLRGMGRITTQLSARDVASDTLDHVLDSLDEHYPGMRWVIQSPGPMGPL
jgi:hypothetical protein